MIGIGEKIQYFLDTMGLEDFQIIGEILAWDDEKKLAFMMAKRIVEDDYEDNLKE